MLTPDPAEPSDADEPTVDELAQLLAGTLSAHAGTWTWHDLTDEQRDAYRLAVGALVHRLDPRRVL